MGLTQPRRTHVYLPSYAADRRVPPRRAPSQPRRPTSAGGRPLAPRRPRSPPPHATGHRWPELGVSVLGARGSKTTATPPWTFASQLGVRRPAAAPPDILAPIPTSCPPLVRRLPGPAIGAPETWSDFRDLGTLCKARKRGGDVVLVFGGCTRHEPPELTGVMHRAAQTCLNLIGP